MVLCNIGNDNSIDIKYGIVILILFYYPLVWWTPSLLANRSLVYQDEDL